jgi:hypothetical protein
MQLARQAGQALPGPGVKKTGSPAIWPRRNCTNKFHFFTYYNNKITNIRKTAPQ